MLIGYARVSTIDQTAALQLDALAGAGVETVFADHGVSGSVAQRPELDRCLAHLPEGDTLVVWRLDRLARSLRNLLDLGGDAEHQRYSPSVADRSHRHQQCFGRLILSVFGALAEFERSLIVERTQAGLEAAKALSARIGRPAAVTPDQLAQALTLVAAGHRIADIAETLGVGRPTLYRALSVNSAA